MRRHPETPLFTAVVHKDPADRRPFEPMSVAEQVAVTAFMTILSVLLAAGLGLLLAAELLGGG